MRWLREDAQPPCRLTTRKPMMAERTARWERVALPLADEAGQVARILIETAPVGRDGRIVAKILKSESQL